MPKPRSKTPNLFWREAGPPHAKVVLFEWKPSPALRARGFRRVDLWADGPPFTLDDCRAIGFDELLPLFHGRKVKKHHVGRPMSPNEARGLAKRMTETARMSDEEKAVRRARAAGVPRPRLMTAELIDDYLDDCARRARAGELSGRSLRDYAAFANHVKFALADFQPFELTKQLVLDDFLALFKAKHGQAMAVKVGGVFRQAMMWAEGRDKWAPLLPAPAVYTRLNLGKPAPRLRVGLPAEMETLLLAFDNPAALYAAAQTPLADRVLPPAPSMGDALVALLWSAARVNDALRFAASNVESGRLVYEQSKTGVICDLPILHAFAERLPAMMKRAGAEHGRRTNDCPLIVNELDKRPYWRQSAQTEIFSHEPFGDRWRAYRALAGLKTPSLIGAGKDRLGRKWLPFNAQDCRDTAVSRLALVTDNLLQIAAWHGSDVDTIQKIAKHYIEISPVHADAAGEKLAAMCRKQGIAV